MFYVGGPNVRKDFHLEEGEEVFYQRQGDINVVTLQNGEFKDIKIKEGEVRPGQLYRFVPSRRGGFAEKRRRKNKRCVECLEARVLAAAGEGHL